MLVVKWVEKRKKYDEPNLVKIEGEGKTMEDICLSYLSYIKEGYNLTVEEIQNYLRCTYQHVNQQIIHKIPHIRITEKSRNMLFLYAQKHTIDESIYALFYKRILVNRKEFQEYIQKHSYQIIAYKRFYKDNFSSEFLYKVKRKLEKHNRNNRGYSITLEQHFQRVMDSFVWKDFKNKPILIQSLLSFPETIYSQNDLIKQYGFRYKVDFYRMIHRLGLNKIKIGRLVRYRSEDIEERFLAKMYISVYLDLKESYGENYMKVIQKRALDLL